jgi:hypothetical protein
MYFRLDFREEKKKKKKKKKWGATLSGKGMYP